MPAQRCAGSGTPACDDVDNPWWKAGFRYEAGELEDRGRRELRRFDDNCIASRQRWRKLVGQQLHGRIPSYQERANADRFAQENVERVRIVERNHISENLVGDPGEIPIAASRETGLRGRFLD